MSLRNTFLNMLGVETPEVQKTSNAVLRNSRDFLKYGNRDRLYPTWSDVKMSDKDLYRGYSYAVIQKRGNKVASLAKENLKTWAKPEVLDEYQKKKEQVVHPYLSLIEDSTEFTEKQFWKNISIYLDLAGRYYLGVLRTEVRPLNPNLPVITTDPTKFIMLNPYEIRRVVDKDGNIAGYIERKKDGRYREWALHQIIEMRELNPFDPEESQWAMTEAAKDAVYTINQSSDYTRHSLDGNVSAPGIITTDVILQDEDFENFRARVTQHTKGEPLFGNGAGAIKWESMQVDLDKAALLDINEINRTTLFAVSGTSKTSLGIEQSGTTRETARVQSEQFVSDTAQPRLEDIIDFLNLDYKKHYNREYKKTGYYIEVQSAVGRDYENETKATTMRQSQLDLALSLIQAGYTQESAYQYATGDIELNDLELEEGLDKPNVGGQGMDGGMGGPEGDNGNGGGGFGGGSSFDPDDFGLPDDDDKEEKVKEDTEDEEKKDGRQDNSADLNGLTPHEELVISDFFEPASKVDDKEVNACAGEHNCTCSNKVDVQEYFEEVGESAVKAKEAYNQLEKAVIAVEKEAIDISQRSVTLNAFSVSDFLNNKQKQSLIKKLKTALLDYWWVVFPMFAENSMDKRNIEFGTDEMFVFNNELQNDVDLNASRVAEGHIDTIMNDVVDAVNRASTKAMEEEAAKLIVDAYDNNPEKWSEWFSEKPDVSVAMKAIQGTGILEENRRIYERALELAGEHYTAEQIAKTIREEFDNISKRRAGVIARNETMRAYAWSQYDSDLQFLNSIGKLEQAYKVLYSRRPPNEEDKICPFCRTLIEETNANPIPFEQPFLAFGESMQAYDNVGTLRMFTATYEDIQGGVLHPNCACEYKLVFKNASGEFTKTLNGVDYGSNQDSGHSNDIDSTNGSSVGDTEQAEVVNGGKGSGNFGHRGRPGLVGGSGDGIGRFLFNDEIPSKNPQPTKEGYVVVHHNTDNENAKSIAEEGLIAGRNLGAYQVSPEEGSGIWTDSRAKKDGSYGGCTVSFQITEEEAKRYAVNDTQHLIPRNIAREDIVCIDKIINENGSNGKPIKVSNLKDNVDYYTKKGLDKDGVIAVIARNSHNTITEQEIRDLINYKKKMVNGGKGSGNYGHYGRPGEVGGSASTKTVLGATPHYDGETLTFDNTQSVEQFRQLKDGIDHWTADERDQASVYFGSLYDKVNERVRGIDSDYSEKLQQSFDNTIELLNERLNRSALSEDVMLYMGSSIYHYIEDNQLPQVGDTVSYGGFNSTSLDPYEAMGWGKDKKESTDPESKGSLLFAIKAKKGAKGIKRFNEHEREVLLPAGAKLKITGRHLARDVFAGEGHNMIDKLYVLECEYE